MSFHVLNIFHRRTKAARPTRRTAQTNHIARMNANGSNTEPAIAHRFQLVRQWGGCGLATTAACTRRGHTSRRHPQE